MQVISDSRADVQIETGRSQPQVFVDAYDRRQLDVDDYDALKQADDWYACYYQLIVIGSTPKRPRRTFWCLKEP